MNFQYDNTDLYPNNETHGKSYHIDHYISSIKSLLIIDISITFLNAHVYIYGKKIPHEKVLTYGEIPGTKTS